jgi:hypothetical protein
MAAYRTFADLNDLFSATSSRSRRFLAICAKILRALADGTLDDAAACGVRAAA